MFAPSLQDVRQFFCDTHRKQRDGLVLTPLEAMAAEWIVRHPEYANLLSDPEKALTADFSVERGASNPFLHLSMHLSLAEQVSIDQPPGVRAGFIALAKKFDSEHEAHHQMMEALGEMLWQSQRSGLPPDGEAYVAALRHKAGK
ncbi:MAG: DUF1841 family protein [Burkholderiaceae bacterium]|nr:DUF1841 family protein [Burkholderiaceae bacterium]